MNADSTFSIGQSHTVCQDYARHGIKNGISYAILSDGCSSSPDTDIGSRLLVLSAEKAINNLLDTEVNFHTLKKDIETFGTTIEQSARLLNPGLADTFLDATLLIVLTDERHVFFTVFGDGLFALIRPGIVDTYEINYPEGFPCYLSYRCDQNRLAKFAEQSSGCGEIIRTTWSMAGRTENRLELAPHKSFSILEVDSDSDIVLIFSDGIKSFNCKDNNRSIPSDEVISEFTKFKLLSGSFIQRRLNGFKRHMLKNNWSHYDDFSVGAINRR